MNFDLTSPTYTPSRLLNHLQEYFGVDSDFALSLHLHIDERNLYNVRKRTYGIPALLALRIIEHTTMTLDDIKRLAGVPCIPYKKTRKANTRRVAEVRDE